LDDCVKTLGKHTDSFDLHAWFYALDASLVDSNLVLPKRDGGRWLLAELIKEAQKRRLPVAGIDEEIDDGEPWAWQCKCGEIHEGSKAQYGRCLKAPTDEVCGSADRSGR
jgi:hypothetical protein